METQAAKQRVKPQTAQIGFRYGEQAKAELERIADKEGVDPSVVYRKIFTSGMKTLYGIDTFRNEIKK